MKWDDLRKQLKSITPEEMALHDRIAVAVTKGWLTDGQAQWILFDDKTAGGESVDDTLAFSQKLDVYRDNVRDMQIKLSAAERLVDQLKLENASLRKRLEVLST